MELPPKDSTEQDDSVVEVISLISNTEREQNDSIRTGDESNIIFCIDYFSNDIPNPLGAFIIRLICVIIGSIFLVFCTQRAIGSWYDKYIYDLECERYDDPDDRYGSWYDSYDPDDDFMTQYGYECYVTQYESFDLSYTMDFCIFCSPSRSNINTHYYDHEKAPIDNFGQYNLLWFSLVPFIIGSCLPYKFSIKSIKKCNLINYISLILLLITCILQILAINQVTKFEFDCATIIGDEGCSAQRNWQFNATIIIPILVMLIICCSVPCCVSWLQIAKCLQLTNKTNRISVIPEVELAITDPQEGR